MCISYSPSSQILYFWINQLIISRPEYKNRHKEMRQVLCKARSILQNPLLHYAWPLGQTKLSCNVLAHTCGHNSKTYTPVMAWGITVIRSLWFLIFMPMSGSCMATITFSICEGNTHLVARTRPQEHAHTHTLEKLWKSTKMSQKWGVIGNQCRY